MKKSLLKGILAGAIAGALLMLQASAALSLPILLSQGLASTSYTASSSASIPPATTYDPFKAFDGIFGAANSSRWQAGVNATGIAHAVGAIPQWIEVDLGKVYDLSTIWMQLYVGATQTVSATFEVYADDLAPIGTTGAVPANLLATFASPPLAGFTQLKTFTVDTTGVVPVRYVQVRTWNEHLAGLPASYVRPAWIEIQVTGEQLVPEPSTFILVGAGLGGLALLRRRRG